MNPYPAPERRDPRPKLTTGARYLIAGIIIVALIAWGLDHIAANEAAKADPPVACQLLGGSWSIWDGWTCN